jgi:hypothetical protein
MLTSLQAKAALVMFESGHFDTADIAMLLLCSEADVCRVIQASRDIVREMHRDSLVARAR